MLVWAWEDQDDWAPKTAREGDRLLALDPSFGFGVLEALISPGLRCGYPWSQGGRAIQLSLGQQLPGVLDSSPQLLRGAGIYFDSGCGCVHLGF